MVRRILFAVLVAGFVTMWAIAIWGYGVIPDRFPTHFDAAGAPDHFGVKTPGTWFALPLIFTVLSGFFLAMAAFTPKLAARYASLVNVPEKQTFLRLDPEARVRALAPLADLALMMPVPLYLIAAYIEWGSIQVALHPGSLLSPTPIALVLVYSFFTLAFSVVRMRRTILSEAKQG